MKFNRTPAKNQRQRSNKHASKKLKLVSRRTRLTLVIPFIILFAVFGTYLLLRSFAITDYSTVYKYPLVDPEANWTGPPKVQAERNKILEKGSVTGYFYSIDSLTAPRETWTRIHFHDTATGQSSNVPLPVYIQSRASVWAKDGTVWSIGDNSIRQFRLTGSPLPTQAELIASYNFGDSDSRVDDLYQLESGAIVALYHKHTYSDTETVLYLPAGGTNWQTTTLNYYPASYSHAKIMQQPQDKSIWIFRIADAWGKMGAAHLSEINNSLQIDWTNPGFISDKDGIYGSDPENPSIAVARDSATGEIIVAYQSEQRIYFYRPDGTHWGVGSYPVIARINKDGVKQFTTLPIYVERVSQLGLIVRPGEIWVSHQPMDQSTMTFSKIYASLYRNNSWESPVYIGEYDKSNQAHLYGISRPEFVSNQLDGQTHFVSFMFAGTSSDSTAPSVQITSPANGAILSGQTTVSINAADNVGVAKVELYVNGVLTNSKSSAPYDFTWDTTKIANATYNLSAKAYDAANNAAISNQISVNVSNQAAAPPPDTTAPQVSINSPLANSTVNGIFSISALATDNIAVTKTELYIDGKLMTSTQTGNLIYSWNTKRVKRGSHTILVRSFDGAGNVGSSQITVRK